MTKYFTKDDDGNYTEVKALSQEAVDNLLEERLKRQKEKFSDYDELKQKSVNADEAAANFESKLQEANERAKQLESQLKESTNEVTKVKLLSEFKLNDDMAEFITGDNEEEMRRRAEKLAEKAPISNIKIEKSNQDKKPDDNSELARKLFGRSDD